MVMFELVARLQPKDAGECLNHCIKTDGPQDFNSAHALTIGDLMR